jgi:integrase
MATGASRAVADTQYLQRKGNVWMVVVEVPKPLRPILATPRLKQSLQTSSLAEANRKKHGYVAAFKQRIDEARLRQENPKAAALRDATEWRKELATASRSPVDVGERTEHVPYDELLSAVKELASRLAEQDPELGSRYLKAATGQGTVLKDQLEPWIAECPDAEQTKVQHRSTVKRYIEWAGEFTTVEDCARVKAGEYVTNLLTTSGLARRTVKRHLSSLSNFWQWLESKGLAKQNVWLGHKLGKKVKARYRKHLSDEKLVRLLSGSYRTEKFRQVLHDLIRLALLHGARLDELCSLYKTDVLQDASGYWFNITSGKTEAARRRVPIHPAAVKIIERRLQGPGLFLFDGLEPGGPDNKRSWYVSKAYGRFRASVGVDQPGEDFHALRTTFIEHTEGLGVPESTVKLIVGHERGSSMTFGVYSEGVLVNLRSAIERLTYSPAIMKLL